MTHLNASSRIMYEEAISRGISCTTFGDNETILMEKDDKRWFTRGSRTSTQSSVGKSIADNKSLTKAVLQHYDLPTAKHIVIRSKEHLERLGQLSFPVVMKPISGAHGRGVVIGITDIQTAEQTFLKQDKPVIFEEMLMGTEYRVVCVNFHFVAAAFRKPAFVTGDGVCTIAELISEKNKHPWRKSGHEGNLTTIEINETVLKNLSEQQLTPESVLTKGREVMLRKTANLSTGGEAWDVTDTVCEENRTLFERIAKACDLNAIGIDIMCTDLSKPITDQDKAGVIEVNASPGLRMHHYPIVGTPRNIAGIILDMVEKNIVV